MHEIPSALAAIQTIKNLAKSAIDVKTTSALREQAIESQAAIIELQTTLLNMQSQYQNLLQEKDALKKQLAEMEDWKSEAAKYELQDLGGGIFVYAQRPEYNALAPAHWLCTRCYEDKQKSVLMRTTGDARGVIFLCFRCENSIRVKSSSQPWYRPSQP
jgi:hypothetical protein